VTSTKFLIGKILLVLAVADRYDLERIAAAEYEGTIGYANLD
jgi:hypothetical protein